MKGPNNIIYLDNAATSFPKPKEVWEAMEKFFFEIGVIQEDQVIVFLGMQQR